MLLYKFRTLSGESFRFTQDIFLNRRLFLPKASSLNDPNEGVVVIDVQNEWRTYANWLFLRNRQNGARICSFSAGYRNTVLWSHYAAEHRGIAIEFDTDCFGLPSEAFCSASYSDDVPQLPHSDIENFAKAYLSKSKDWSYEQEWRYIASNNENFLNFHPEGVRRVLLGWRVTKLDEEIISFWAKNVNPGYEIPLVRMKLTSTEYVLYEESELGSKQERIQTA